MNKTLIALGFFVLIFGAIVGNVVLAILAPDRLGDFNGAVVTILGVGTAAVVTIYGLGSQGEKLKTIERNTNGNLTALRDENTRLTNVLIDAGIDPQPTAGGEHVA